MLISSEKWGDEVVDRVASEDSPVFDGRHKLLKRNVSRKWSVSVPESRRRLPKVPASGDILAECCREGTHARSSRRLGRDVVLIVVVATDEPRFEDRVSLRGFTRRGLRQSGHNRRSY